MGHRPAKKDAKVFTWVKKRLNSCLWKVVEEREGKDVSVGVGEEV